MSKLERLAKLRADGHITEEEYQAKKQALLDEFSNADGLDPRRRDRLQGDIRDEARALGLERSHLYKKARALGLREGGDD